jgi:hypothetical protein
MTSPAPTPSTRPYCSNRSWSGPTRRSPWRPLRSADPFTRVLTREPCDVLTRDRTIAASTRDYMTSRCSG